MADLPLKIYFVVGEQSGDDLGAGIMAAFAKSAITVQPVGLGGPRLAEYGLNSLFDISQLSVMGVTAVLARLPSLVSRVYEVVKDVNREIPDVLVIIDSPDFTHAVAKRVRKSNPSIPIINYVCPSVWAWRQGRARKMVGYIDLVLALLPFEPKLLAELGGPPATFVGHPLAQKVIDNAENSKKKQPAKGKKEPPMLAMLPGSRSSEISRLLPIFAGTLSLLEERGNTIEATMLAVPHLESQIRDAVAGWRIAPTIACGDNAKEQLFSNADIALAASGTVTLELAVYRVPMVATYLLDPVASQLQRWVGAWTASLPNLIADYPFVPERFNEFAKAGNLARSIERLIGDTPERQAQERGIERVAKRMKCDRPAGEAAMAEILRICGHVRSA